MQRFKYRDTNILLKKNLEGDKWQDYCRDWSNLD